MPRPNRGAQLVFNDRRQTYYIVWYRFGAQTTRSTRTNDPQLAQEIFERFLDENRSDLPVSEPTFRFRRQSVVYFLDEGEDGPIKIGTAFDVQERINQLQCGNPRPLRLLATAPGTVSDEIAYHKKFADHRLSGEWFSRHPAILREIEALSLEPVE